MKKNADYQTAQSLGLNSLSRYSSLNNSTNGEQSKPLVLQWSKDNAKSTKDPRVFGPPLWFTIHNSAAHYPIEPSRIVQERIIEFIKSIPYLVVCDECFYHARAYIANFSYDQLRAITRTRQSYFFWTVDFHNFVNKRLGKPQMSYTDAYDMYRNPSLITVFKYADKR